MLTELDCRECSSLPPLAWCLGLERGASSAKLLHGPWVETGSDFFVEGAWDGDFAELGFDSSCLFMGSGGKLAEGKVLIATPCHNLDPLFLVAGSDRLVVSNSLAFALESAGLELDLSYLNYKWDLLSSLYGMDRCAKSIPTRGGQIVHLLHYTNVGFGSDLQLSFSRKAIVPDWTDFTSYRRFITDGLAALKSNADAPGRRNRYEPLATLSSGYDSTASAVLATEIGCRCAVTSRVGGDASSSELVDDCGTPIGEELGLQVTEYDPMEPRPDRDRVLAEFAACGETTELNFIGFEPELPGKLVFTGNSGGFWRPDFPPTGSDLARPDPGGGSLGEFRLRVGFIHVPVPMMGAIRHDSLYAITCSEEMRPWSIGGDYDRPIPRRILEEKGVPRGLFAQTKKGGVLVAESPPSLMAFYERHRRDRGVFARLRLYARWRASTLYLRLLKRCRLRGMRSLARITSYDIPVRGARSLVVHWGTKVVRDRYRVESRLCS